VGVDNEIGSKYATKSQLCYTGTTKQMKQNNKFYIIITSRLYKIYIVCIKMFMQKNIKQEQKKIKNRKIKSNI